ncbi:MAG: DNA polymerase III subunit chi [Betaproteobacteria bacterium]|nr:DNA polymerase III subunit chi [Betaproteobacteria bacterium]
MTLIDFYVNAENRLATLSSIGVRAMQKQSRLFVLTQDAAETDRVDRFLWTQPAVGFLPHCRASHRLAGVTPIIVDHVTDPIVHEQVLVNFTRDCEAVFSRFERLVEIVGLDEEDKAQARARFRFYRDRGYEIRTHDLAKSGNA